MRSSRPAGCSPSTVAGSPHAPKLPSFLIGPVCVSNDDFARFADATGYVTDAERFGCSFVFEGLFPADFKDISAAVQRPGSARSSVPTGGTRRERNRESRTAADTRSCMSPGTMPPHTATGAVCGYPPRPSGNARPAVGRSEPPFPGWCCPRARRRTPSERLPRQFPRPATRVLTAGSAPPGRCLPAQRLRHLQHDRHRLGVVLGLVRPVVHRDTPRRSPTGPETENVKVMRRGSYLCLPPCAGCQTSPSRWRRDGCNRPSHAYASGYDGAYLDFYAVWGRETAGDPSFWLVLAQKNAGERGVSARQRCSSVGRIAGTASRCDRRRQPSCCHRIRNTWPGG